MVAAFLSDPRRPIETSLKAMTTTPHLGEAGPHPVVASTARELLNKSDNERSGVLSTAMSFLGLYRDPVVAHLTRRCDWRIVDLIADDRPATHYLVVPPSDISRTKPLIRLVLNQIGRARAMRWAISRSRQGLTARCHSASHSRRKSPKTRGYSLADRGMDQFGKSMG